MATCCSPMPGRLASCSFARRGLGRKGGAAFRPPAPVDHGRTVVLAVVVLALEAVDALARWMVPRAGSPARDTAPADPALPAAPRWRLSHSNCRRRAGSASAAPNGAQVAAEEPLDEEPGREQEQRPGATKGQSRRKRRTIAVLNGSTSARRWACAIEPSATANRARKITNLSAQPLVQPERHSPAAPRCVAPPRSPAPGAHRTGTASRRTRPGPRRSAPPQHRTRARRSRAPAGRIRQPARARLTEGQHVDDRELGRSVPADPARVNRRKAIRSRAQSRRCARLVLEEEHALAGEAAPRTSESGTRPSQISVPPVPAVGGAGARCAPG